ncbi:hypothetical protein BC826DRAFT_1114173 [Russula brevipes]|nr:hypothetical protein BC826DRAFT_1114173 [Russula brevipes]
MALFDGNTLDGGGSKLAFFKMVHVGDNAWAIVLGKFGLCLKLISEIAPYVVVKCRYTRANQA